MLTDKSYDADAIRADLAARDIKAVIPGRSNRWHQTLKIPILQENYFLPGDLEAQIEAFVEHYNQQRYHESLSNVTPADANFGRAASILKQRERIKRQTIEHRRLQHHRLACLTLTPRRGPHSAKLRRELRQIF